MEVRRGSHTLHHFVTVFIASYLVKEPGNELAIVFIVSYLVKEPGNEILSEGTVS